MFRIPNSCLLHTNFEELFYLHKNLEVTLPQKRKRNLPMFGLQTVKRLGEILPTESIFKMHKSSDVTLIAPWYSLTADMTLLFCNKKTLNVDSGRRIPL